MAVKAKCTCGDEKTYTSRDAREKAAEWRRSHEQDHVTRKTMLVEWFAACPPMSDKNRAKIFEVVNSIE